MGCPVPEGGEGGGRCSAALETARMGVLTAVAISIIAFLLLVTGDYFAFACACDWRHTLVRDLFQPRRFFGSSPRNAHRTLAVESRHVQLDTVVSHAHLLTCTCSVSVLMPLSFRDVRDTVLPCALLLLNPSTRPPFPPAYDRQQQRLLVVALLNRQQQDSL